MQRVQLSGIVHCEKCFSSPSTLSERNNLCLECGFRFVVSISSGRDFPENDLYHMSCQNIIDRSLGTSAGHGTIRIRCLLLSLITAKLVTYIRIASDWYIKPAHPTCWPSRIGCQKSCAAVHEDEPCLCSCVAEVRWMACSEVAASVVSVRLVRSAGIVFLRAQTPGSPGLGRQAHFVATQNVCNCERVTM